MDFYVHFINIYCGFYWEKIEYLFYPPEDEKLSYEIFVFIKVK